MDICISVYMYICTFIYVYMISICINVYKCINDILDTIIS